MVLVFVTRELKGGYIWSRLAASIRKTQERFVRRGEASNFSETMIEPTSGYVKVARLVDVLGESSHDTVLGDEFHGGGDLLDESLISAQVITEEELDAEKLVRLGSASLGLGLQDLNQGVVDLKLVALIIDTVDVAEPGSSDET